MAVQLILSDARGVTKVDAESWSAALVMIAARLETTSPPLLAATVMELDAKNPFHLPENNNVLAFRRRG